MEIGYGTYNSRSMAMGGSAVKLAADEIVAEILSLAGRRLNLDTDRLVYDRGAVYRKGEEDRPAIELDDILAFARETGGIEPGAAAIEASVMFKQSKRTFSYGAHGARVAVDVETGRIAWNEDRFGGGTVILAGDDLLILRERGELILAEATPTSFRPLARAQILGGVVRAYPALADGTLYARNQRELVAIELSRR